MQKSMKPKEIVGHSKESSIDENPGSAIMNPEEVARFLRQSTSWVNKNWRMLGGVKLGGFSLLSRKGEPL
jgi:hypothetical protein